MADDFKSSVKDVTGQAKASIDEAAGSVQDIAKQTKKNIGAVGGNVQKAVDKSLNDQPYTTLAMAAAIGFVIGAIWKA